MSEQAEQQQIVALLRTIGATVYVLGTRRRRGDYPGTMQTPGLPDVFAFLPVCERWTTRRALWVEVKGRGGRLRPEQRTFVELCASAEVAHVVGGYQVVVEWLLAQGYLRAASVPHYRQPAVEGHAS